MENYYFKHSSHFGDMFGMFEDFYRNKLLSDVIVSCQGRNINAHRMVLCAGSDYFRRLLTGINTLNHMPVLIINEIPYEDMEAILEFIYRGQIVVSSNKVESLRQAAFILRVKGFENFLRKPFYTNNGLGSMSTNVNRMQNGAARGMSLLNGNKRYTPFMNDFEIKKLKSSHQQQQQQQKENQSIYSSSNQQDEYKRYSQTQYRSQLEAALRRGPNHHPNNNNNGNAMSAMKKFHLEQLLMKRNNNFDNETIDLKMEQSNEMNSVTITPVNGETHRTGSSGEHSVNSSISDSCDENEENQKNESTEHTMNESKDNSSHFNNDKHENEPNENENGSIEKGDYESDDSNEVNYTYELDPNTLAQWDNTEEKITAEVDVDCDPDGMDEEDYFESMVRPNNNIIANMVKLNTAMLANMAPRSGQPNNFFYCEHCPKYFFDEDHLQIHIKRSHDVNKMNQCNICGKAYAWKSGLYKHKRHVHNIGGPKPVNGSETNGGESLLESPVNSQPPTPQSSVLDNSLKVNNNNTSPTEIMA